MTQLDIQLKCYCRLNLLRASVFNFERLGILGDLIGHPSKKLFLFELLGAFVFNFELLDLLRDSIGHPSQKLLSFQFAQSLCIQFRVSWYITVLNRTSEFKVIVVCIFYDLPFSIMSVSVYYGTQYDIRVKIYCRLNIQRAFILNFERLNILRGSIGHPS